MIADRETVVRFAKSIRIVSAIYNILSGTAVGDPSDPVIVEEGDQVCNHEFSGFFITISKCTVLNKK